MGVNTTPDLYKSLTFDGESSRNYGVYITGEAVFNAPARAVEMITIPGRNGAFALDKGHFENIEVTYPAGIYADNEEDFAEAISDFRNFLCSRSGYCRLTDDYNADEYRLAIYKSGLEVEPAQLKAGEFNITFECKPQRFLTSGETAVTVANNGTITNPTLFDSKPLLLCDGYGTIGVNGEMITIENIPLGEVKLMNAFEQSTIANPPGQLTRNFNTDLVASGDTIFVNDSSAWVNSYYYHVELRLPDGNIALDNDEGGATVTNTVNVDDYGCSVTGLGYSNGTYNYTIHFSTGSPWAKGTSKSTTASCLLNMYYRETGSSTVKTKTVNLSVTTTYNGSNSFTYSGTATGYNVSDYQKTSWSRGLPTVYANSTKSQAAQPAYIDLDIGEAYGYVNNELVSLNNIVSMPSELPVLKPGSNTITYNNTVTQLKITPRWWKV